MLTWACAFVAVWACVGVVGSPTQREGRHVVYMNHNNYPSLLYINSASGSTQVNTRDQSSDIIQLILYPANPSPKTRKAVAVIQGSAQGTLTLTQDEPPIGITRIEGVLNGLTPGLHGFHVHEYGDTSKGCISAGGHYNPYMRKHGAPENLERHIGDLGNIEADVEGNAHINMTDPLITLMGPRSVVGRTIVVHAGPDDLGTGANEESFKTGNAGGRVGCGVIGFASSP